MLLALAKGEVMTLMNYEDEQSLPLEEAEEYEPEEDLSESDVELEENVASKKDD